MKTDDAKRQAEHIAQEIFNCGDDSDTMRTQRIQFRGPNERDMGGLCFTALCEVIRNAIESAPRDVKEAHK